jgi:hypothetical protein
MQLALCFPNVVAVSDKSSAPLAHMNQDGPFQANDQGKRRQHDAGNSSQIATVTHTVPEAQF